MFLVVFDVEVFGRAVGDCFGLSEGWRSFSWLWGMGGRLQDSSKPLPSSKATLKQLTRSSSRSLPIFSPCSFTRWVTMPAITDESMPPLR